MRWMDHSCIPGVMDDTSKVSAEPIDETSIPLPDITQALRQKKIETELARIEAEQKASQPKVNRRDKEAFARVSAESMEEQKKTTLCMSPYKNLIFMLVP